MKWTILTLPGHFPDVTFSLCSACGKIAGCDDPLTTAAIYSVMIESPGLGAELCGCKEDQ